MKNWWTSDKKYGKYQLDLKSVLRKQRNANDKSGLGYSQFYKPSSSKTIFVKSSNTYNNFKIKKVLDKFQPKVTYRRNNL